MTDGKIKVDWYFDFVSPFAYLQLEQFSELPGKLEIVAKPVLLGALLTHWGSKGPAEIPPKRQFTYRYAHFRAEQLGIPFRMPPMHPFNPIQLLRLVIATGGSLTVIREIFRFLWADGRAIQSEEDWRALLQRVDLDVSVEELSASPVKEALRSSTDAAIAKSVFGVPTFSWGEDLFWGEDATKLLLHCLNNPEWLESAELRRISRLPVGVQRTAAR